MINSFLEEKANKLLKEAGCFSAPIDINKCAAYLKVKVNAVELDSDISGFLVLERNGAHIGYNTHHSTERSRFTIAHELSHFMLHAKITENPLFIDKDKKPEQRIMFRDENSSTGEFIKEREANAFAAALLMPKELVENEIKLHTGKNALQIIPLLAKKFNVSSQAMNIRLVNLDILDYNND